LSILTCVQVLKTEVVNRKEALSAVYYGACHSSHCSLCVLPGLLTALAGAAARKLRLWDNPHREWRPVAYMSAHSTAIWWKCRLPLAPVAGKYEFCLVECLVLLLKHLRVVELQTEVDFRTQWFITGS
jgi:hypothetical protein